MLVFGFVSSFARNFELYFILYRPTILAKLISYRFHSELLKIRTGHNDERVKKVETQIRDYCQQKCTEPSMTTVSGTGQKP